MIRWYYCYALTIMIFSSYYEIPELACKLPNVGDIVTYNVPSHRRPEQIIRRFKKVLTKSLYSVFVSLKQSKRVFPIEVIQYWPEIDDIVEVSAAQYLNWQTQVQETKRSKLSLPWNIHGLHKVIDFNQNLAHLKPIKGDDVGLWVPTSILRVTQVMGVRSKAVNRAIRNIANPEKVKPSKTDVTEFEAQQRLLLNLLTDKDVSGLLLDMPNNENGPTKNDADVSEPELLELLGVNNE